MPEVLSTSPFTPYKLKEAVERSLAVAPENALTATVEYGAGGELRSTIALKIDKDRWVLGVGGFVSKGTTTDMGAYGYVTVRF